MKGPGKLPTNPFGSADWRVLEISASKITIEGLAIDGSQRADTGEQTHLVQIVGPAQDTELRRLYLNLPVLVPPEGSVACKPRETDPDFETRACVVSGHGSRPCKDLGDRPHCSVSDGVFTVLGWYQGGDCIRSLGEVAAPVNGVTVADSYAAECDRSFIAFQRASHNFTITGNVTRKVTDQVIDQEPTGSGGLGKVIITGNRFERGGADAQGGAAISLTGNGPGDEMGDAMIVSGNILDGGVHTFNVSRVSIEHNVINGHPSAKNADPVVKIIKFTDSLRLIGNDMARPPGAVAGPIVQVSVHNTGFPTDVTIALNTVSQNTDANAIIMEGVQNVTIVDNTIQCKQPSDDLFPAIRAQSALIREPGRSDVPVPLTHLIVSQNRARGACRSLLHLAPFRDLVPVGAVTVTENQTKDFAVGVQFGGAILPSVKPRISDNLFEGAAPADFVRGPPGLVHDGNNGPQP
jgi:hypothetical protein